MSKYWFRKRKGLMTKDLGYGWIPISWQGWLIMLLMLALIPVAAFMLLLTDDPSGTASLRNGVLFLITILVVIGLFAYISHKKTRP